jgi:hypothetical protein
MMKFLYALLLLLPASHISGQNISDLDKRHGFKTLKIGDKFSNYQNNVALLSTNNEASSKIYDFTPSGNELFTVFDEKMDQILLTFDKNETLVTIMLHKFYKGNNSLNNAIENSKGLNEKFKALFGNASSKIDVSTTKDMQLGLFWLGLSINLKSYIDDYGITNGTDVKVVITDNKFATDLFNSGF